MEIVWRSLCICYQMCHLSLLARYSFDQGKKEANLLSAKTLTIVLMDDIHCITFILQIRRGATCIPDLIQNFSFEIYSFFIMGHMSSL